MKSKLKLAGIIALIAMALIGMACNSPDGNTDDNSPCTHTWGTWSEDTAPTCMATGTGTRTCTSCGTTDTNTTIPANPANHNLVIRSATATCTTGGDVTWECDRDGCSHEETETDRPPLGHNWNYAENEDWYVILEAHCMLEGKEQRKCQLQDCDDLEDTGTQTRAISDPDNHYIEVVSGQAPTCLVDGHGTIKCQRTGCTFTQTGDVLPATEHYFINNWAIRTPSTCHTQGVEFRRCTHEHDGLPCNEAGYEETNQLELDPNIHEWGEYVQTTLPTCIAKGIKTRTCPHHPLAVDPEPTEGDDIDPEAHAWGNWTKIIDATCIAAERQERVCGHNAEHKEQRDYGSPNLNNHLWTSYTSNGDATCLIDGTKTATCDREGCDVPDTVTDIGSALQHIFSTTPATCTAASIPGTCTREGCEVINPEVVVSAFGHLHTNYIFNNNATCLVDGTKTAICDRNGCEVPDTVTDIGSALQHIFSTTPATCTAASIPGTCTREGCEVINPEVVVLALGHDGIWTVTNSIYPATSTGTCSRCSVTSRVTQIGDTGPAGGKIIYIAPTGFEVTSTTSAFTTYTAYYLEAAPANAVGGTGAQTTMRWSTRSSSPYPDVTGTLLTIGSGRNNTALIIAAEKAAHLSNTYIYAALACDNYSVAGYNDWFLPSRDELNRLYSRRANVGVTFSGMNWFWSSSQGSIERAWFQSFDYSGSQHDGGKTQPMNVRAVRAF